LGGFSKNNNDDGKTYGERWLKNDVNFITDYRGSAFWHRSIPSFLAMVGTD